MQVTKDTPTKGITIGTVPDLHVAQPYSEGHKCKANEADALNQLVQENVRNNKRKMVQEMVAAGKSKAEIQSAVSEYCTKYEFGERSGGGFRTADPVEAECMDIARKMVRRAYIKRGTKLKDVTASQITASAQKLLANKTHGPKIRAEAERRVAGRDEDASAIEAALV
jgi:hypothetical protein